jgi:hypothetical protein
MLNPYPVRAKADAYVQRTLRFRNIYYTRSFWTLKRNSAYCSVKKRASRVEGYVLKTFADPECLQVRAAARIPDLDGVVVRRRRQSRRRARRLLT